MKSINIIHAEHRALVAVLQAFRFILTSVRNGHMAADHDLLDAMIEYITEVPDKLHHPKEDDYLFVTMRERIPESAALIDKLQHDHAEGAKRTVALRDALAHYRQVGAGGHAAFEAAALRYIDASWEHLNVEERELLPLARKGLSPTDWASIDAAFAANKDPWSGPTGEFRALYSRIVGLVPAPLGLGEPLPTR